MAASTFAFDCKKRRAVSVNPRKEAAIMGDRSKTLKKWQGCGTARTFELQELWCSEQLAKIKTSFSKMDTTAAALPVIIGIISPTVNICPRRKNNLNNKQPRNAMESLHSARQELNVKGMFENEPESGMQFQQQFCCSELITHNLPLSWRSHLFGRRQQRCEHAVRSRMMMMMIY